MAVAEQAPDIFDQVAPPQPQQQSSGSGDVFDQAAAANPVAPANPYAAPQPTQQPAPTNGTVVKADDSKPDIFDEVRGGIANSFVGRNLETYAPGVASALHLTPTESEGERQKAETDIGYHPVVAAKQIATGAQHVASGAMTHNADEAALGGVQVLSGAGEIQKPLIVAAAAMAPLRMAAGYITGILAGAGAKAVAQKMGLTPNEQEFAHVAAFFIPSTAAEALSLHAGMGESTARVPDAEGNIREVPVKTAAAGGRGFGVGVGKGEDGTIYAAGRVGPFSARVKFGGNAEGPPAPAPPQGELPAPAPQAAPPSAAEIQAEAQAKTVEGVAAQAQEIAHKAAQIAGLEPPPPPPPAPGEPGSKTPPLPEGMKEGMLTQQTVDQAGGAIRALPDAQRPKGMLEAVGNLAKWMFGQRTIVGPDNKVVNVDSQKTAQTEAVNIINGEIDRQNDKAEADQKVQEEARAQQEEDAKTAEEERQQMQQSGKAGEGAAVSKVEIPDTPQVAKARARLASAPDALPAEKLDQLLRGTVMLTKPVRDALVQEHIASRANLLEAAQNEGMTGKATPAGQAPEEIDKWIGGVKAGETPFAHIQKNTPYTPAAAAVDGLAKTKVTGAGDASGTYYHDPAISSGDIRTAARKGQLGELVEKWKTDRNPEPKGETASGSAETKPAKTETAAQEPEPPPMRAPSPFKAIEGKRTMIHLADGSSIPATHMLAELSSLSPSHSGITFQKNPVYPPKVQERSYDKSKDEQLKVIRQENEFAPELMSNTDPTAATGPPIVTSKDVTIDGVTYPAGTVLGGNSRTMTAQRVYTSGAEAPYLKSLSENHRSFGFPPEGSESLNQPLHVRAIEPPQTLEEMHRLGSLLNKNLTQSLDVFDQSVSLGRQLSPDTRTGIADLIREASSGDSAATLNAVLSDKRSGRAVVRLLQNDGIITDTNRTAYVDPSTDLLTAGARNLLGNALLAHLLDTRELMETTPAILKQKLLGSIGPISAITSQADGWNLGNAMREAARQYGELSRGTNMSPAEAVNQGGIFGAQRGPIVEALIKKFDQPVQAVRQALSTFTVHAAEGRNPTQLGLGPAPSPVDDFNFAFGTEITPAQFDEEMKALGNEPEKPQVIEAKPQVPPSNQVPKPEVASESKQVTAGPKPFSKGDQVTYTTNAGKQRAGEIEANYGQAVKIKDAKTGSSIRKPLKDVQYVAAQEAAAEPVVPQPAAQEQTQPNAKPSLIQHLRGLLDSNEGPTDYNALKKIVTSFDGAEPAQLRMKEAQESYEAALAQVAHQIATAVGPAERKFDALVKRYEGRPNLSIRTSTSISNQAYSTPAPLAFIADRYAGIGPSSTVYEPTAGNGMLVMAADPKNVDANELGTHRQENLRELGFNVTGHDATQWSPAKKYDAVVANPPFGSLPGPVTFDGGEVSRPYSIVKLEHLIALKALSAMKDNGRGTIIIGASKEPGEVAANAKPFFNYLYSHYNVVADFELDGDLYSRQGAAWPVRVIAVDGRARSSNLTPAASTIERVSSWKGVYEQASEHLGPNLEGERRADPAVDGAVRGESADAGDLSRPVGAGNLPADRGEPGAGAAGLGASGGTGQRGPIVHTGAVPEPGVGDATNVVRSDGDVALSDRLAEDQPRQKAVRRGTPKPDGHSAATLASDSSEFQSPYTPFSEKKDVNILAPVALNTAMHDAMENVSDVVGDVDQFVSDELGYSSVDEMQKAFMGLQVDTIAAAIYNISRGKATIIADQTGIGKGRQAAAVIRWAELHGRLPIFMTAKPALFSAMYEDLHDIGSGDAISPLLLNANENITHPVTSEKIYQNPGSMKGAFQRILETGKLPEGRNALFGTYSQINTSNVQQQVLQRLADNAVFVLDESHKAGGDSNTGIFMQGLLPSSRGVAYLSATYAKRPDNLPLYAPMTDMGLAIPDREKLIPALEAGGAPLQAVLSYQLAQGGQLFRREASFKGISFPTTVDTANQKAHEAMADKVTEILRAIVRADSAYHEIDFPEIQETVAMGGGTAESGGNKAAATVNHMEFSSIVHNLTRQLLMALKADGLADKAIASIRAGEKPVLAFEQTMGSFLEEYVGANAVQQGEPLVDFGYPTVLKRALDRTRYYKHTDETGQETRVQVPLEMLSDETRELYEHTAELIQALKVDIPVSPLDWIRHRIEQAGHTVAEITGRTLRVDYSKGHPVLSTIPSQEKRDRVRTARDFNSGALDSLLINAAGAEGLSLHPSVKFKDQRPRRMMIGQAAGDINVFMQMLGRINRTGQVVLPRYENYALALPAELRPAVMLSKKMKSLNANTSSNTRSATSIDAPDMFNKYGDMIVQSYLSDNPLTALALRMSIMDPKASNGGEEKEGEVTEGIARKATGRSALLPVAEQKAFLEAITETYNDYIAYLDETGQNDLEPKTYDFEARETGKPQLVYQGTDPRSPFGQDAHFNTYSIKRQGKPYTPEEVTGQVREGMNGAPNDRVWYQNLIKDLDAKFSEYRGQLHAGGLERAAAIRDMGKALLSNWRVGSGWRVDINGETYNAVVTGIEGSKREGGNPYAPSGMKFTLAINGPLRAIRIPGSQLKKIAVMPIDAQANIKQVFHDVYGDARQVARIVTGNLLGAYGAIKGVRGRIVSFTMADGSTQLGIVMPAKFDPAKNIDDAYAMRTTQGALDLLRESGNKLEAPNGDVQVGFRNGYLQIGTKMARSVGGKIFLDKAILATTVGGDFAAQNGLMRADVQRGRELDALRLVMNKATLYPQASARDRARELDSAAQSKIDNPEPPKPPSKPSGGGGVAFSMLGSYQAEQALNAAGEYAKKAIPATWNELVKFVGASGKSAMKMGREVAAAVAPATLADSDAKDIMGAALGDPAMHIFQASQFLTGIDKMFEGMTPSDQIDFVDRWQAGRRQPSTELQQAREFLESVLEQQRQREMDAVNLGRDDRHQIELTQKENYFPNRYSKGPNGEKAASEAEQIARIGGMGRRPLEGNKAFMKEQKYTLKQAVEKGAIPLGNPVRMVLRRLQEGAKFVAAQYAMFNGKEQGLVQFLKNGKKMPPGYADIDDKIAKVWRPVETENGKLVFVQSGKWVIEENFGRLLNNYLSTDYIRGTEIGANVIKLKNFSTELRLALSPFHFGYITVENFASGLNQGLDRFYNQGIRDLSAANLQKGLEEIGKAALQPFTAVHVGGQMIRYARNPEQFLESPEGQRFARNYPDYPHLQQLLFRGGLRWGMGDQYRSSFGDGFEAAMKAGELGKGVLKAAPWISHAIMKPLFEHYIPRSKWVFAVNLLSSKLAQYSEAIANGSMTEESIAREVAMTTDNRFGEFNWDALYLNNTLRTAMQLAFRSATWKIGSWRGLAGAVHEQFSSKMFDDKIFERIEEEDRQFQWLRDKTRRLPQLGANAGWIISMGVTVAVMGSALVKMLTHKWPWEWAKDAKNGLPLWANTALEAMHPRTGVVDDHGQPVRISFPTGLKDYEHGFEAPARYLKGSESDVLSNAFDTMTNRDIFNNYVYNPNDPTTKAFMQGLMYNLRGDFMPMSAQSYAREYGPQDAGSKLARATGMVGGAPKSLDQSHALTEALSMRKPHTPMTPEDQEAHKLAKEMPPTRASIREAARNRNMDYLERVVLHELTYDQAVQILTDPKTSEAERAELRPIVRRKQEALIKRERSGR